MTPTYSISAPMHPWAKVAMPVAAAAIGGAAAYGIFRATDDERSTTDRVVSGALGVAAVVGAGVVGGKLGIIGAGIGDDAMKAVREGADYATYPWPKGTATVTKGNGTWHITPHEGIGDSLFAGGVAGGMFGGAGGLFAGLAVHGND